MTNCKLCGCSLDNECGCMCHEYKRTQDSFLESLYDSEYELNENGEFIEYDEKDINEEFSEIDESNI